jgi:hypothetical protein
MFLISVLAEGEWSASRSCLFTSGRKSPLTHWIGSCVSPRARLDDAEKRKFLTLTGLELRPLGHSTRSQSLYRLRYPGFPLGLCFFPPSSLLPHLGACSRFWSIGLSVLLLDQGQSVGFLGRVISSLQGTHIHKH